MKIRLVLSAVLLTTAVANANETNTLYLTLTAEISSFDFCSPQSQEQIVAEAKTNRESLPAGDFPEGNWGEEVNGLQLSLRFDKETYTNGEPIIATLLARNTTNQYVSFPGSSFSAPIGLAVNTAIGQQVEPRQEIWERTPASPKIMPPNGGMDIEVPPKTQRKFFEDLNKLYDLTNGTYSVHAVIKQPVVKTVTPDGKPGKIDWMEIESADVQIKIEGRS